MYIDAVLSARKISVAALASRLASRLNRPVVDKTGLNGLYNLTLTWTPDDTEFGPNGISIRAAGADSGDPSLFRALEEQLGLKLETQLVPTERIVVDGAERPSQD